MEPKRVVAETVHLFHEQYLEDLLRSHHPIPSRLRVVEVAHQVCVHPLADLGMPGDKLLNLDQLICVFVVN